LAVLGFELRAFIFARQAFYHLSHSIRPIGGFYSFGLKKNPEGPKSLKSAYSGFLG
jgi:hypothetical protein